MSLVTTKASHVQRAIDLSKNTQLWIGIGKTSAWGSPDVAPVYNPELNPENQTWYEDAVELTEPIGYKKVETAKLVVPNINGIIEVFDAGGMSTKWAEVTEEQAKTQGARHLYVTVLLDNTLPYTTYRQTSLHSSLVKAGGVPDGRTYLLANEVSSQGTLEAIICHDPQPRSSTSRQRVQFVIEL